MSNFERVFNKGEELHPMVNKRYFTIPLSIHMIGFNKKYFDMDNFDEFINKIKTNNNFRNIVVDRVREYCMQPDKKLISDKSGEVWYFIDYEKYKGKYTLKYVNRLCELNTSLFLENYTDIFGNDIEFEAYNV